MSSRLSSTRSAKDIVHTEHIKCSDSFHEQSVIRRELGRTWKSLLLLAFPLLGLRVSLFTLWVPTLHTEGLQQSEVSSVQPASLRLRWVYVSAISVCFRTPRLSLGHPGSLTSMHDLKCMRTQTAPLFNAPRGRRGNRAQVPFPRIHPVTWTGVEPTTLGL